MKRILAMAALTLLASVGCGGSDSTSPQETVSGTYSLQTVNGSPPPTTLFTSVEYKLEIMASTYTLKSDGKYANAATFRETINGTTTTGTDNNAGTWTVTGTTIVLVDADTPTDKISGTISGGKMTLTDQGMTAVWQKQ